MTRKNLFGLGVAQLNPSRGIAVALPRTLAPWGGGRLLRLRLARFGVGRARIRASTAAPLDLRRSAMRATSWSERIAGRPTERAIA
jgi:hypothetical protein